MHIPAALPVDQRNNFKTIKLSFLNKALLSLLPSSRLAAPASLTRAATTVLYPSLQCIDKSSI